MPWGEWPAARPEEKKACETQASLWLGIVMRQSACLDRVEVQVGVCLELVTPAGGLETTHATRPLSEYVGSWEY